MLHHFEKHTSQASDSPREARQTVYWAAGDTSRIGGLMPKTQGQSARDMERTKTEKLLKKVGYTALKDAGIKSKRPSMPNLKAETREK